MVAAKPGEQLLRRLLVGLLVLAISGTGLFWLLTAPERVDPARLAGLSGDAARGERIFHIGGCASCHAAPEAEGEARLVLAGGRRFATDFGVFIAPNVSPGPEGIGGWSFDDFANALLAGVGPDGRHYYPAFPYASYVRMRPGDVADLWAYLATLPASDAASAPHEIGFPFSIRRGLGLWKRLYLDPAPVAGAPDDPGRYLVEGPGHCGECHTARDALGGPDLSRWLGGAPNPDGKGRIPNITPGRLDWSAADIAEYLKSGFTPEYDVVGGSMAEVVRNTARLTDTDRAAISDYLKAVPAVADPGPQSAD